jgi:hypothetical protein
MTETKDGGAGTVEVEVSFILRMIATDIRKCATGTAQDIQELAERVDGLADACDSAAREGQGGGS